MLELKTTKAIKTGLHDDETHKVIFKFRYSRISDLNSNGMKFMVDPFIVLEDGSLETIPGGSSYPSMSFEEVSNLIEAAKSIVVPDDNAIIEFDNLVAAGIKIYIISEGLWKGQLTLADFE